MKNDFVLHEGEVPYFESRLFKQNGVRHAFFTRIGGVSEGEFSSLNFAVGAGDKKDSAENVYKNHSIAASVFGLTERDVCRSYQTHTANVELVTESDRGRGLTKPAYTDGVDGLVTAEKDLVLSIRTADCVPILLVDTAVGVCGAVHAGWRGTASGISENAVALMESRGASRERILAAIGPCIGQCCYEVGAELYDEFEKNIGDASRFFVPRGEKYMLDLTEANRAILTEIGIKPENISSADMCTRDNEKYFFSHRRDGVVRGTMSAFICN